MTSLPRLVPDQPFPPYAYIPGRTPHPTRDPDGHSYGAKAANPKAPDPENWRDCREYLYGLDLFNHGFYWEAHEAWEELWVACSRSGLTATYLKALINLAAAGMKASWGSMRGMRANAENAMRLFDSAARQFESRGTRFMGLDVRALADSAARVANARTIAETAADSASSPTFDLLLWPE